jgi:hypothetical protein
MKSSLLLPLLGVLVAESVKTSSWWFNIHSPEYTAQALKIVKKHSKSITGLYYYAGFHIDDSGVFQSPSDAEIQLQAKPFLDLGLTVGVALGLSQTALQNGAATKGVQAAAATAARNNLTSYMVDFEPSSNKTNALAHAYATYIETLTEEMHSHGLKTGMCVSSYPILTSFGLYAKTGVDQMMSMASTYFGRDVHGTNEYWVNTEIAAGVSLSQLHVGIGSTNDILQKWDYHWSEKDFKSFMVRSGWCSCWRPPLLIDHMVTTDI